MGRRDNDGKLQPTPEIQVLRANLAIRSRAKLYVSNPPSREAIEAYALGACCWGADEIATGRASTMNLTLHDGVLVIRDDGDGMPVSPGSQNGDAPCEIIMTSLYGCRDLKQDENAKSICDNAMPMAVVNALSESCELQVWRDGYHWRQNFAEGAPTEALHRLEATSETGTQLTLRPDTSILHTALTTKMLLNLATTLSTTFPCGTFKVN